MRWMRFKNKLSLVVCVIRRGITKGHVLPKIVLLQRLGGQMEPGPLNPSVLTLQREHRSTCIWEGEEWSPLVCRNHLLSKTHFEVPDPVANFISGTQFSGIQRLSYVSLHPDFITALVERWRQETHTFHLTVGEATITLQDVNVLLGLKVGGLPITGRGDLPWGDLLEHYLGKRPPPEALQGQGLKMKWLKDNFQVMPNDANELTLHQYVRAYLLYMIGTTLFPDKTGNKVSVVFFQLLIDLTKLDDYSWGSGVLACLYRNLCLGSKKGALNIGGCLILLQLWCWERISIGRPKILRSRVAEEAGVEYPMGSQMVVGVDPLGCKWLRIDRRYTDHLAGLVAYRHAFDTMTDTMFKWQPYTPNILTHLPAICTEDTDDWIVKAPLICFEIVEWHYPERVVRQFGYHPEVPPLVDTDPELHAMNRRMTEKNYEHKHRHRIARWMNRKRYLLPRGAAYNGFIAFHDPYMEWYREITRQVISPLSKETERTYEDNHDYYPTAADYALLTQANVFNYNHSSTMLGQLPDDVPMVYVKMLQEMQAMSLQALQNTRQAHLLQEQEVEDELITQEEDEAPRYNLRHMGGRVNQVQGDEGPESSNSRRAKRGRYS